MADSLTLTATFKIAATYTNTLDLQTSSAPISHSNAIAFTDGTSTNQAELVFADTRSLAISTSEDLDLAGSLTDAFGRVLTFTYVKGIYIKHNTTTATTALAVGGASANQFINWVANSSDIVNIRPGGAFMLVAPDATGYAVTASTGDLLKINNADAAVAITYSIVIWGEGTTA
jgi:hypothetical protein